MNYIYDILVNFSRNDLLDFYEWDKNDNIEHLRRIPLYKITSNALKNFKYNNIKIDKIFLNNIKNKTEVFSNKMIEYIEYCSIFTDGSDLVVLVFDNDGNTLYKSLMLLDEAEEVLEESEFIDEININYKIIKKLNKIFFLTRYEKKVLKYLKNELDDLIKNNNFNKLKYLYYEWYDNKIDDMDKIRNELYKIINEDFSEKHVNFYNLIKFSNKNGSIKQK